MAIPYYYPTNYQPPIMQNPVLPQSNTSSGINWVQGESAAKSYPVAPNNSVLLMDSEESVMYIKSCDQSGMPLPLRIFDYTERKAEKKESPVATQPMNDYVSRDEFEKFKADMTKYMTPRHVQSKETSEVKSNA